MEEKEKKTKTTKNKQTTRSKNNPKKKTTAKKTTTKVNEKKKTTTTKKVSTTTNNPKKTPATKKVVKEVNKKNVEPLELEKTLVFNGLEEKNVKEVVENLEQEKIVTDDKVIEKNPKNKYIIAVIAILIVLTIGIATSYVLSEVGKGKSKHDNSNNIFEKIQQAEKKTDNEQKNEEPKSIEEATYSTIKTITLHEFEQKVLAKENMNIIVSSSTCYYCLAFEPIVHEVLTELNKSVYRINTFTMNDEDLSTFREYYAYTTTPTIFTVTDGYIKNELVGARSKEKFMEWAKDNLN